MDNRDLRSAGRLKRYGFLWVTLLLFAASISGHWMLGWRAYVHESEAHREPVVVSAYVVEMLRDTLENWQSEFLQLIWQVGALAYLLHVGSSQSREGNERLEAKVDFLMAQTAAGKAKQQELDQRFART